MVQSQHDNPGKPAGLLDSLTTFAVTLVSIAHNRLALLSNDLEEDREHLMSLLVLTLVALFCLGVGVLLATILLVVLFWDTQRILLLCLLTGTFLLAGLAAGWCVMHKAKNKPRSFAASLLELFKDRETLAARL